MGFTLTLHLATQSELLAVLLGYSAAVFKLQCSYSAKELATRYFSPNPISFFTDQKSSISYILFV